MNTRSKILPESRLGRSTFLVEYDVQTYKYTDFTTSSNNCLQRPLSAVTGPSTNLSLTLPTQQFRAERWSIKSKASSKTDDACGDHKLIGLITRAMHQCFQGDLLPEWLKPLASLPFCLHRFFFELFSLLYPFSSCLRLLLLFSFSFFFDFSRELAFLFFLEEGVPKSSDASFPRGNGSSSSPNCQLHSISCSFPYCSCIGSPAPGSRELKVTSPSVPPFRFNRTGSGLIIVPRILLFGPRPKMVLTFVKVEKASANADLICNRGRYQKQSLEIKRTTGTINNMIDNKPGSN